MFSLTKYVPKFSDTIFYSNSKSTSLVLLIKFQKFTFRLTGHNIPYKMGPRAEKNLYWALLHHSRNKSTLIFIDKQIILRTSGNRYIMYTKVVETHENGEETIMEMSIT